MESPERLWRDSPTRGKALASLAALVAGSPLLSAQRDPRPLSGHERNPGFAEMESAFDFEPVFVASVPRPVYDYTAHGADSEFTIRRNRDAFDWVDVVARPSVGPASVSTRTTVLGLALEYPIFVAPSALHVALHPDGEIGMHKGATAAKTPMIISNVSSQPVDKIVAGASGPTWFQFYPRQNLDESRNIHEGARVRRTRRAGRPPGHVGPGCLWRRGVQAVIEMLQTELGRVMGCCGKPRLEAIDRSVVKVHALTPAIARSSA